MCDPRARLALLAIREGLLMIIRAIEDYLGLEHVRPTKRERIENEA